MHLASAARGLPSPRSVCHACTAVLAAAASDASSSTRQAASRVTSTSKTCGKKQDTVAIRNHAFFFNAKKTLRSASSPKTWGRLLEQRENPSSSRVSWLLRRARGSGSPPKGTSLLPCRARRPGGSFVAAAAAPDYARPRGVEVQRGVTPTHFACTFVGAGMQIQVSTSLLLLQPT